MTEHGEEVAIAAVNRIRSGGVAGFFCREEFEVIVDPGASSPAESPSPSDPASDAGPDDGAGGTTQDDPTQHDPTQHDPTRDGPAEEDTIGEDPTGGVDDTSGPRRDAGPATGPARAPIGAGRPLDADDETIAEAIGRRTTDRPPARLALDDQPPVFAGPVAPGADPAKDRFLALLERRLDEASATEDEVVLRRSRSIRSDGDRIDPVAAPAAPVAPAPAPAAMDQPAPAPSTAPSSAPVRPATGLAVTTGSAVEDLDEPGDAATLLATTDRPRFWRRLDRAREELASFLPSGSVRTAVVGPLPLASMVVRRLQARPELTSADVVVLTDRAGIVSEPSWRIERNGDRLVRALADSGDRPMIVVVDVPTGLPTWLGPLQRRLRSVGVGLFRYAVAGQPTGPDLERYRQGADVPYAIDLTSRVEPGLVVGLVADRHPVISVAGADLGPELLLALRRHIGAVEPAQEPMTDG